MRDRGPHAPAPPPRLSRSFEVVIGGRYDPAGYADPWDGAIDEVRMWDRAFDSAEIERLYDAEH